MEKLYNAAVALLKQRTAYFEKHPELLKVSNSVEDEEYEGAWDELQRAVDEETKKNERN